MRKIQINDESVVKFHNNVDFCVGTGRIGLALTKEYYEQLKFVQEEIGFKHIRGHGLLSDDMAIYQEFMKHWGDAEGETEYCFTYLDRVFDMYLSLNIRPFLELGFMPSRIASGKQTIFYWKGNTTPPKEYEKWNNLIAELLKHLLERYGEDEVLAWPIEVWNEPNLPGFWEHADQQAYFTLFKNTFNTIKGVDKRFKVGGPAVCGGSDEVWISAFMKFCHDEKLKPDFITRHHYTVEFPERQGHYDYHKLMNPEDGFANLATTRAIIDGYKEYKGLPIHITEFNTSYTPRGIIHDTNLNAALLAQQLSRLGDINESYSYWTFGDVFEEQGVQFTPFHGGFGLVADGCIPKPTFWTFAFFKKLEEAGDTCLYRDDNAVVIKTKKGYMGVLWNTDGEKSVELELNFPLDKKKGYSLMQKIVDEDTCNPLKVWHDLGEPAHPTAELNKLLRESAYPLVKTQRIEKNRSSKVSFEIKKNGVIWFEIKESEVTSDRGYDYDKVLSTR